MYITFKGKKSKKYNKVQNNNSKNNNITNITSDNNNHNNNENNNNNKSITDNKISDASLWPTSKETVFIVGDSIIKILNSFLLTQKL